jgi:hypothetical protein
MMPPDVYVPVPLHWKHVLPGDVFVGKDGALWHVEETGPSLSTSYDVIAVRGAKVHKADVDPDDSIQVLVPVTERDALRLTRDELGATLVERRTGT